MDAGRVRGVEEGWSSRRKETWAAQVPGGRKGKGGRGGSEESGWVGGGLEGRGGGLKRAGRKG